MAINIKNWSVDVEKPIVEKWRKSERFKINPNSKNKIYSIDTPPPYVNAPIHIGQAITYCYMDFFARFKRMKGFDVIFPLGLDRNGLPIEMAAEKKYGISPFKNTREEFLEACKKLLEQTSNETSDTFTKLGISFTSYEEGNHIGAIYKTDSEEYRKITQATFIDLFKKGLVYEDKRINNWDTKLRTTLADSEIDYKDIESSFNYVIWKVKETGEEVVIGTTRPELICTCGRVIFNPKDDRYKHLEGKMIISPIFEDEILIKSDNLADIDKGTGLAMMCSAGDLTDIQFFRDNGIEPRIAIEKDGTMNNVAGFLEGMKVREARQKIIEVLKEKNLLKKQEKILHRTPVSERSGAEIEFIEMDEFYLRQIEFKNEIKKISNKINFYPKFSKKILMDWINSVKIDWPISRRRYYATSIPLWVGEYNGNKIYAVGNEGKYYEPWRQKPEDSFEVFSIGKKIGIVNDFKGIQWKGEERVLDTWMDSSISELVLLKYKQDGNFFKKAYPCTLRPQGKEIIRTWLYYTLLRGYLETGKSCFEDVWVHQHIVDFKGYKMSKSKGNIVDPQKLLKDYGAEAIRFWSATEGDLSKSDLKCSEERIKGELKTLNKLLNISKFVSLFEKVEKEPKLTSLDKLFINYVEDLTFRAEKDYEKYDFYNPAMEYKNFLWNVFASNYVELVKARAYNSEGLFSEEESLSAKYTLNFILDRLLILMHPIIPQITEYISLDRGFDIIGEKWPKVKSVEFDKKLIVELMEFNSRMWKKKKDAGISLRENISGIRIPSSLKDFEKDLRVCHSIN